MKTEPIGVVDLGVEGHDAYRHVELDDAELAAIEAGKMTPLAWLETFLHQNFQFDGSDAPGSAFCHRITLLPFPNVEHRFVAIVHVRRDV